jgi:hypothetical protein
VLLTLLGKACRHHGRAPARILRQYGARGDPSASSRGGAMRGVPVRGRLAREPRERRVPLLLLPVHGHVRGRTLLHRPGPGANQHSPAARLLRGSDFQHAARSTSHRARGAADGPTARGALTRPRFTGERIDSRGPARGEIRPVAATRETLRSADRSSNLRSAPHRRVRLGASCALRVQARRFS